MRSAIPIPRVVDVEHFHNDYFLAGRPVVVENAARRMPAFDRWTDDYLVNTLGGTKPNVRFADGRLGRMPLAGFLHYLAAPADFHSSRGPVYLTDFYVSPCFSDLGRERLAPDAECPLPRRGRYAEWISLYAGPPGSSSPMHQDIFATHTWLAELRGEKVWRLCAPGALDPIIGNEVDAFGEDDLGCDIYETTLVPGDVIYLPPDWWHQVRNSSSTLAVSGNFCTFAAARRALDEALASDNVAMRDVWIRTWTAILAEEHRGEEAGLGA